MNVWTYWEGPTPPWIELCLASIRHCCAAIPESAEQIVYHELSPATLAGVLPADLFSRPLAELPNAATRADAVRSALLALHGGLWLDADTICLRPPTRLPGRDRDLVYSTWDAAPKRVFNGYIYARPGSPIAQKWFAAVNQKIRERQTEKWTSLGEGILTALVEWPSKARYVPRDTFCPIDVDSDVARLFTPGDFLGFVQANSICFGLNHSWMMHHRRPDMMLPIDQMAESPLIIHRLLTWARCQMAAH